MLRIGNEDMGKIFNLYMEHRIGSNGVSLRCGTGKGSPFYLIDFTEVDGKLVAKPCGGLPEADFRVSQGGKLLTE